VLSGVTYMRLCPLSAETEALNVCSQRGKPRKPYNKAISKGNKVLLKSRRIGTIGSLHYERSVPRSQWTKCPPRQSLN
jgi:hypothetical protein